MALLEAFQRYVAENDLATHDDRILLTVSGGVDSMVMLSLFTRSGYSVGVAHCNFQLRGAESEEDEVLVEEEAKKYGVEFLYRDFRPGFRAGQAKAREMGLYLQKYCGCIFSEEDRYEKKIGRARTRFAEE